MKKLILFFFLALLLMLSLASADFDKTCCIKSYIPPGDIAPVTITQPCPPGYLQEPNCFDSAAQTYKDGILDVGCCCLDGTVYFVDGGNAAFPEYTSKLYCDALGYVSADAPAGGNCSDICNAAVPEDDINSYFVTVSGHVYVDLPNEEPKPYEGAIVASLYDYSDVTTLADGSYDLGRTPGNPLGSNEFRASIPDGLDIGCTPGVEQRVLAGDTEINFTLTCWEQTPACEPEWTYGQWSECYPFEGKFYQIRIANDSNDCGTTLGLLPLKKECEGTINYGECGNNVFDEGTTEQCDLVDGQLKFLHPTKNTILDELSCQDIDNVTYTNGDVGCSNTCTYDFSECELTCNPTTCRNRLDCDNNCAACEGNTVVCGDPCDDMKPDFLTDWRNETDLLTGSRNVYDLYQQMVGSLTPAPIMYNETTGNVRLQWYYEGQCTASIYGYKVYVCEESADGNSCKANTKQEIVLPNPGKTEEWISGVLEPHKSYCYNVCALKEDGRVLCAENMTGELWPCFDTGDEECMVDNDNPGLNCKYDKDEGRMLPKGCGRDEFGYTNLTFKTPDLTDCSGKICVETAYDPMGGPSMIGATCVNTAACGMCNGLFGMYAGYNLYTKIPISTENGNAEYEESDCSDLQYNFLTNPQRIPEEDNHLGLCFKDTTRTVFDQFDTCEKVRTCYDYTSENACLEDPCFRFVNSSGEEPTPGCEWQALTTENANGEPNDEFGLGVCKPVNKNLEKCNLCDKNAPLNFCTDQQCGLFGSCFYKDVPNHLQGLSEPLRYLTEDATRNTFAKSVPTCINDKDMACYFYDTKEECEGESPVKLDVIYDNTGIAGFENSRVYGSNTIIPSSDELGLNLCRWNNNSNEERLVGCVKDADGSVAFEGEDLVDDCASNLVTKGLDCLTDNVPPTTNMLFKEPEKVAANGDLIPVYGLGETAEMDFPAIDDVSTSEKIKTRATFLNLDTCGGCVPDFVVNNLSLSPTLQMPNTEIATIRSCYDKGCELYPQKIMQPSNPWFKKFDNLESGEYALLYYSEDEAHNLEKIQMKHLFVDNSSPIITFDDPVIVSYKNEFNEDDYKSDLNISFHTDEDSVCEGTLVDTNDISWSFASGDLIAEGTDFNTSYLKLLDGYYTFRVTCKDKYQNLGTASEEIEVQGDMSIRNPLPRGKVFHSPEDVVLSIDTGIEATGCYYSLDRYSYPADQMFVSGPYDGGVQTHSQSFADFDLSQVGTWLGNYEFTLFTACNFTDGNRTEGNIGDVITFSIDNRSPETKIEVKAGDYWVDLTENLNFSNERLVKLSCADKNELTPDLYYGCEQIEYCFADYTPDLESFTASDCDGGAWLTITKNTWVDNGDGTVSQEILLNDKDIGGGKRIYYRSVDQGGNRDVLHRKNIRIRDIEFIDPQFTVSKLQE